MIAFLTLHIPSTAADTTDEWYIAMPGRGKWRIIEAKFAPATAVAANDTNYVEVTITTNDGAAGSDSSAIGSFTTQVTGGAALALKTTRDITLSGGSALELTEGQQIKIAKTDPGSGGILDGTFTFCLEKIN